MCGMKTTNINVKLLIKVLYIDLPSNVCEMFVTNSLYIYGLINQSYIINYTHAVVDNLEM